MKSIKVTILGKSYSIKVNAEDEQMMYSISDYVNQRFKEFEGELKGQPDSTITALALLSIGEDLYLERKKPKSENSDNSVNSIDPEIGNRLSQLLSDIKLVNSDI